MGIMDNFKDKSQNIMDDPKHREKIEAMASEHGISIDEAKDRYIQQHDI